jgi:Holliday junction resolvasome RuvABC endonuclease subunit
MTMKTLSLDLGINTGWAFADLIEDPKNGILDYGSNNFSKQKTDPEGVIYRQFRAWLVNHIKTWKPGHISYENVRGMWRNIEAQHYYETMRGIMLMEAYAYGISTSAYHQSTVKKSVIGRGTARKPEIMAYVDKTYNICCDDDTADAIIILEHHYKKINEKEQ